MAEQQSERMSEAEIDRVSLTMKRKGAGIKDSLGYTYADEFCLTAHEAIAQLQSDLAATQQELSDTREALSAMTEQVEDLRDALSKSTNRADALRTDNGLAGKRICDLVAERDTLRKNLAEVQGKYEDTCEQLDAASKGLSLCEKYDTSPTPEYGEADRRGVKPPAGQRWKTPREHARDTLAKLAGKEAEDEA